MSLDLIPATHVEPRRISWLWKQLLPAGMLSVLASRPGVGKSLFACHVAAELTSADVNVILSNQEDSLTEVVRPRLEAAGAKLERVHLPARALRLPGEIQALESLIERVDAGLVIFDAAAQHLTPSLGHDQAVRRALSPLAKLLERTGCACLVLHHTTKGAAAHPLDAVGGSAGGLAGSARLVYLLGRNPKADELVLAPVKSNIGPLPGSKAFAIAEEEIAPRLDSLGPSELDAFALVATLRESRSRDPMEIAVAAEWLTTYLALGKRAMAEVREDAVRAGVPWIHVQQAADLIDVVRHRSEHRLVWDLPDGHPLRQEVGQ